MSDAALFAVAVSAVVLIVFAILFAASVVYDLRHLAEEMRKLAAQVAEVRCDNRRLAKQISEVYDLQYDDPAIAALLRKVADAIDPGEDES